MKTIFFWGVVIGIISEDPWHYKVTAAFILGIYSCVKLFFLMRKKKFNLLERLKMKTFGATDEAIKDLGEKVFKDDRIMTEDLGLTSPKVYLWEFMRHFIGTAIIALIVGFIKDMF